MMVHLIKLIWNRKRNNVLLTLEIVISFMVLFGLFSLLLFNLNRYQQPMGFDYRNVWEVNFDRKDMSVQKARTIVHQALRTIRAMPGVIDVSSAEEGPYYNRRSETTFNNRYNTLRMHADENYQNVFNVSLMEGKWFQNSDAISGKLPVVINRKLKDSMFEGESVIGKVVETNGRESVIVGVVDDFRYHELAESEPFFFVWTTADPDFEHEFKSLESRIFIKVEAQVSRTLEEEIMQTLWSMAPEMTFDLNSMEEKRKYALNLKHTPLFVIGAVGAFLLINVALGIFGVLWYNMSRRQSEVGLRRALGGNVRQIFQIFLAEILILTTFGIICGTFFTMQVPLLGMFPSIETSVFLKANVLAGMSIYFLITLCALYPSHLASKIEPALALKSE